MKRRNILKPKLLLFEILIVTVVCVIFVSGSVQKPIDQGGTLTDVDINGCWITHTSSGTTRLDLTEENGIVRGNLTWGKKFYPIENGSFSDGVLKFQVKWNGFFSELTFDSVSSEFMSGQAISSKNVTQKITADRTCTPEEVPLTPTPSKEQPGFEALFAIAGLLAVAYLLRRRG